MSFSGFAFDEWLLLRLIVKWVDAVDGLTDEQTNKKFNKWSDIAYSCWYSVYVTDAGAFDILVYTDKNMEVPEKWSETGPAMITNSQEVKLRSFSTAFHKVDTMVAYKNVDWYCETHHVSALLVLVTNHLEQDLQEVVFHFLFFTEGSDWRCCSL